MKTYIQIPRQYKLNYNRFYKVSLSRIKRNLVIFWYFKYFIILHFYLYYITTMYCNGLFTFNQLAFLHKIFNGNAKANTNNWYLWSINKKNLSMAVSWKANHVSGLYYEICSMYFNNKQHLHWYTNFSAIYSLLLFRKTPTTYYYD